MFVEEYLTDFNATQAAIRAGYSDNPASAKVQGCRLLTNANVAKAVRAGITERAERLGINADDILLRALKLYEMSTKAEPVLEWDPDKMEMVKTGEYEMDGATAAKALVILGKLLGLFQKDRKGGADGQQTVNFFINTMPKGQTIEGRATRQADVPGLPAIHTTPKDGT